ncbi:MAG: DUF6377 domain-containing protein [Muribaculaceae bacterium]
MKLNILFTALLLSLFVSSATATQNKQPDIDQLLKELDNIVADGDKYQMARVHTADSLYRITRHQHGQKRIDAFKRIYSIYSHYQSDSAMRAIERLSRCPEAQNNHEVQQYITIARGEVLGMMGLYVDAHDTLNSVDTCTLSHANKLFYFQTFRSVYGWITDYSRLSATSEKYAALTDRYRDSILATETNKISYDIALADKHIVNDNVDEALNILLNDMDNASGEELIYIYFNLAEAYKLIGNEQQQLYYLILASIADLKAGVTEYLALPTLAHLIYKKGDIDRAYQYLIRSMDDANFCNARLRTMEISNIFPIIDKAYKQKETEHRFGVTIFTLVLCLLVVALLGVIYFVLKQNKKLNTTRTKLAEANNNLKAVNTELQNANKNLIKTDRVKEEYIARFLERCRSYLDALESYRHSLLKLAKNNQHEALMKQLKDHNSIGEEQQRFYHDFDKAFLDIHPRFVENFNNMLKPEERVYPKSESTLTTEMRIFALIRLGITDSNKIAHFLNYSLATIYNYRSRITNKSVLNKDQFNENLMKC